MADATILIDSKIDRSGLDEGFKRIKSDMGGISAQARKMGNDIQASFSKVDFSKPVARAQAQISSLERQLATTTGQFKTAVADGDDKRAERLDIKRIALYERLETAREKLAIEVEAAARKQAAAEEKAAERETAAAEKKTNAQEKNAKKERSTAARSAKTAKKHFGSLTSSAGKFGSRLNGIVSGAFVFNVISQALSKVTKYFGSALKANDTFSKSFQRLKGALLTAFQPIYEYIVPALVKLVNLLTAAAVAVGKFFAAFTGKSYGDMSKNAAALYETAQGMEAAGGAAKDAEKMFSGLDEVKTFSDNSGGGGGGAAKELPEFSENNNGLFNLNATDLMTKLNEMIAGVDWVSVGDKFAAGIDNALSFIATSILKFDWHAASSNIATMLNEVIKDVNWENLGVILGAKFILLIEGLGGLFSTIDWAGLGNAIASAFTGLWNSIDWVKAAKMISNGFIGAISSLSTAIKNIDWNKLGRDIAKFVGAIDWNGLFVALADGIGAALGGLTALLWGIIEDAWNSVVEWWREVAYEDGEFTMKGLLDGIWQVIKNIGQWIKDNVFTPFVNGFKEAFGIHSPSTVMAEQGNYIIQGLLQGITGAWNSITGFFDNALTNLKTKLSTGWANIKNSLVSTWESIKTSASRIFNNLVGVIKTPINGIIGAINGMVSGVAKGINAIISALNKINFKVPSWVPAYGGRSFGFNLSTITAPSIPYLAQGAVIPPNAPFMAVLGDQKSGKNIEAPADLISQIVGAELDKRGAKNGGSYTFVAQIDRRTIFEEIIDEADLRLSSSGSNPLLLGY